MFTYNESTGNGYTCSNRNKYSPGGVVRGILNVHYPHINTPSFLSRFLRAKTYIPSLIRPPLMFPNILIVRRDRLLRAPHHAQNLDPVAVARVRVYGPWRGR
jgi:hypothetical protein